MNPQRGCAAFFLRHDIWTFNFTRRRKNLQFMEPLCTSH
jgi:hypothetical protein